MTASFTANGTSLSKLNDGELLVYSASPNRWTCEGSPTAEELIVVDFGVPRDIHTLKFLVLDDSEISGSPIRAAQRSKLSFGPMGSGNRWRPAIAAALK